MEAHYATIWESVADAVPDHVAIVHGTRRLRWGDYDDRAARLAATLTEAGLGVGAKVGILTFNAAEWAETQFAALKNRQVPINLNHRYLEDELAYVLENADAEAL